MRLMFVYWRIGNAGSAQDILQYARVAKSLGHEVVMYAPPESGSPFECSLDLESADAVIFVFEWNLYLFPGGDKKKAGIYRDGLMGIGHLNVARLFSRVPRRRRVILDCDGMYNDSIQLNGDFNHLDAEASRRRTELCDSLSDKIFQPTYRPLRPNVRPFFFHAYDPSWERPLDFTHKDYGMIYVGNNWFRWNALHRVLRAIEPIRENLGRAALVGQDWAVMPWWVSSPLREQAYFTDPDYLKRLAIELREPITVDRVIPTMGTATFNPVLIRPLFDHLGLVTCRTFETPAANTIPLFALDAGHVRAIYGDQADRLVLQDGEAASEQILDVLRHPEEYAQIVRGIRRHLAEKHSYAVRLQELVRIVAE
jgi:Glycosyl transferases group 1